MDKKGQKVTKKDQKWTKKGPKKDPKMTPKADHCDPTFLVNATKRMLS